MTNATDNTTATPKYEWTQEELQKMSMTELLESLARVMRRIGEIAPSI